MKGSIAEAPLPTPSASLAIASATSSMLNINAATTKLMTIGPIARERPRSALRCFHDCFAYHEDCYQSPQNGGQLTYDRT